uniref:tRNA(Ile)-lysidine synthase, chloroplastic n=1 Tax=Cliftonaea pectinata TaxID=2007206 RepID=A0A1Z1MQ85_9FLOR|nr:tRNA Ile-lysidine synthetase [Cliftonaea pectinata]ARW68022.1 tRNA Ile-lysidine synthetase [Cliftonaea pectinata]
MTINIKKIFNTTILNLVQKYSQNSILIAISGGQDSICLVKLIELINMVIQLETNKVKLEYIYIDHQWKKNSPKQVQHITNYLKSLKKTIYIYQIKNRALSEEICRKYRYHIIIEHAIKYRQKIVVTAHTETDKIETFFQNIIRGTGLEGITSLNTIGKLNAQIFITRPLINQKRYLMNWLCKKFCLPVWSDITNYNYYIQRNRIRHELIPYISKYFNPNIEKNLKYLIHNYYIENEYIKKNSLKVYLTILHNYYIAINYKIITKYNLAIQSRIIQIFYFHNFSQYLNNQILMSILKLINKININVQNNIKYKKFQLNINKSWIYITII